MKRAETGPMRFGDDWTGVFIRGDNATALALYLGVAIESMPADFIYAAQLRKLHRILQSCDERNGSVRDTAQTAILISTADPDQPS